MHQPISIDEYQTRIQKAQALMQDNHIDAIYVNAGTNLYYFTGTPWHASERMVGALIPAHGEIEYIVPHFEVGTFLGMRQIEGTIHSWQEHENPYDLFANMVNKLYLNHSVLGIDESAPFFLYHGLRKANNTLSIVSAKSVIRPCREQKSAAEIALIQHAMTMTLQVHKATSEILRAGITTQEVTKFIDDTHRALGATSGSSFCIVLFGPDTAYPHGVKNPKPLAKNDTVLIDTGCLLEGYNSDITRTYVFGKPSERQRTVWHHEKEAQAIAFNAAQIGTPCGDVDSAARAYLEKQGYGPEYGLPGLPHRTGHGIGLDIHESPYLVRSDRTPLAEGMCFSNEPMICVPGEFGIRHEDHFYMTAAGPKWFTEPAHSIDEPFANVS